MLGDIRQICGGWNSPRGGGSGARCCCVGKCRIPRFADTILVRAVRQAGALSLAFILPKALIVGQNKREMHRLLFLDYVIDREHIDINTHCKEC